MNLLRMVGKRGISVQGRWYVSPVLQCGDKVIVEIPDGRAPDELTAWRAVKQNGEINAWIGVEKIRLRAADEVEGPGPIVVEVDPIWALMEEVEAVIDLLKGRGVEDDQVTSILTTVLKFYHPYGNITVQIRSL